MTQSGFRSVAAIAGFVLGFSLLAPASARAQALQLIGRGGEAEWGETPVLVEVKAPAAPGAYVLEGAHGAAIPAVVFTEEDRRWLAAVLPSVPAGARIAFAVKPAPPGGSTGNGSGSGTGGVRFHPAGSDLEVTLDDRPFTTYRTSPGPKPYFYPLVGPTGDSFTRAYPMIPDVPGEDHDHPHHRGCWFTYGEVDGIDFWSEAPPKRPAAKSATSARRPAPREVVRGTIRETSRRVVVEGPVAGRLRTTDDWVSADGRKLCEDVRTATFYRTRNHRIIDFAFVLKATHGPVTFGDTKEGMFGIRVASSMDVTRKKGGKITNAEGLTDTRTWGKASPWVDYVGPVKGQTVGIAILNRPDSFRFPTIWHVRDYGLFAANPLGWRDFHGNKVPKRETILAAGDSMRLAYRVILHRGDTAAVAAPALFQAYAGASLMEVRSAE